MTEQEPGQGGIKGKAPQRKGSVAGPVSSVGGALDSLATGRGGTASWQPGRNAISTLLQPPIVRTGLRPHMSAPASSVYKAPSSRDIPPVALTNIPHVELAAFRPYLSQVGTLYDAFQEAKAERRRDELHTRKPLDSGLSSPRDAAARAASQQPFQIATAPYPRQSQTGSIRTQLQSPLEAEQGSTSEPPRLPGHAVAPLSTIPSVYSEDDFHLENPRTFDIVSERSDVVRRISGVNTDGKQSPGVEANGSAFPSSPVTRKPLATNAMLQEKLSWYMDTVELHLISSISTASTTFFAALGSLKGLHSEAEDLVQRIRTLRADLHNLDDDMAVAGLEVMRVRRRKDNLRKLRRAVNQVKKVTDGVSQCRDLIEKKELHRAMDLIEDVEDIVAGTNASGDQENGLIDLRQVKAIDGVFNDLHAFRIGVGRAFESQFVSTLLEDLRKHLENAPSAHTIQRWSTMASSGRSGHKRMASEGSLQQTPVASLRAHLPPSLIGLGRSQYTSSAAAAYRDTVLREVKNVIRRHLPSSDDDDTQSIASSSVYGGRQRSQQEKSSILARNLRALDAEEAEELFIGIYTGVCETLRRLAIQVKVLLDLSSVLHDPGSSAELRSPPKSPAFPTLDGYLNVGSAMPAVADSGEIQQLLDLSSLPGQVVDVAQAQIVKILKVRTEQTVRLPLTKFLRYITLNRLFADECETVSGRGGGGLKNIVNGHIKDYMIRFGDIERQALAESMDADQWDAVDFTDEENEVLQRVLDGSTKDAEVWLGQGNLGSRPESTAVNGESAKDKETNGVGSEDITANGHITGTTKDKIRRATVDEQKFILPTSALVVLRGIEKLESIIAAIPGLNPEVAPTMIEYLKLFSSRSYQLILGAGATKSAGLKNITTKHLALAHQALSFISTLIPYVREFVRRQPSPPSAVLAEFDKVKHLYYDHQTGIQDKLIEIMSARSKMHVSAMKKINWDEPASLPTGSATNGYMETLTKETTTLHRVLSKHLPEPAVKMIMGPIFENYKQQWGDAYREVEVTNQEGKESLLRDAEAFNSRVNKLEGAGDTGAHILEIVREKSSAT
ncbi:MAG: Vacuolar protein sorting-associated protein 54 [Watsoniomyces obsoletus]|nr:MAG: Vacuolar protein sorting-associated protein 54 [Watsoniomyces obsoletus]